MKKSFFFLFFIASAYRIMAVSPVPEKEQATYDSAYDYLAQMLDKKIPYNFRQAVLLTEDAYLSNGLNQEKYNQQINSLLKLCQGFIQKNEAHFLYEEEDRASMLINAAVFSVMSDTTRLKTKEGEFYHLPFRYDFEDFAGIKNWQKMLVSKLLNERTGNCHSLPYLYKILVEELGGKAYLALAPNHMYIKQQCNQIGFYNTELSSASFPTDAWLMASGYIHLNAIKSGIYMEKLSQEQSIAFCLYDLAKGYEKKFGKEQTDFIEKCLDKSLKHFPNNVFALLAQSELTKLKMEENQKKSDDRWRKQYQEQIVHIYQLGYRKMPDSQYLSWMMELKEQEEKYLNKEVMNTFNSIKDE